MTKLFSSLFMACLLLSCTQTDNNYRLIWSQEFTEATIDTSVWNFEDNSRGGGNAEMQYYTPRNASVGTHPLTGDSCLILSAQREDYLSRPATSARLNTQDKFSFQYGRVEARICFPHTADGIWPAFWMLGNNLTPDLGNDDSCEQRLPQGRVAWPRCGEIDIVEMGHADGIKSGLQDRYFNGACHWGEDNNTGEYFQTAGVHTADYAVQGSFHLFTLDWTPDSIAMYLDKDIYPDAAPYFQLSLRNKDINQPGHYFNHPFYLVLNMGVGGYFTGLPAAEKYPAVITADDANFQRITGLPADGTPVRMYVDYIRVYQK